jgi:serine phosphatase RsbU (regulator of sigma subunit)
VQVAPEFTASASQLFLDVLRRTHLSPPSDVPGVIADSARTLGATDMVVFVVDHELEHLVPLDGPGGTAGTPVPVEGTMAGRAFAATTAVQADAAAPGRRRLWLPLLDGTERVGALELTLAAPEGVLREELVAVWERYAHLAAQMIVTKSAYGDFLEVARRSRRMDLSTELVRRLLPPSVFATDGLVIAGLLEPAYQAGGDCYDYAVNSRTAHLALFDAMGHGLAATSAVTLAVAAYRGARRAGLDLLTTCAEVDAVLVEQFRGERFTTAVLAELDLESGCLRWVSAGHPSPLLLRDNQVVKTLDAAPATPLGVPFDTGEAEVAEEHLEPGDAVLLFTDGLPEARTEDGSFFSLERLAEFVERQAAAGYPAPETLRRLRSAVLAHQHGRLQDDATALLVQWRSGAEHALLPPTV